MGKSRLPVSSSNTSLFDKSFSWVSTMLIYVSISCEST